MHNRVGGKGDGIRVLRVGMGAMLAVTVLTEDCNAKQVSEG